MPNRDKTKGDGRARLRWESWGQALVAVAILTTPAVLAAERKPPPWEKPLQVGRYLYLENCSVCHEINQPETKKLGPSLFRLFQNEKLPLSGGKLSEEYVRVKIQFGGDVMPPFVNGLTAEEIDLVIGFIRSKK